MFTGDSLKRKLFTGTAAEVGGQGAARLMGHPSAEVQ
jgi:hypothetical protein